MQCDPNLVVLNGNIKKEKQIARYITTDPLFGEEFDHRFFREKFDGVNKTELVSFVLALHQKLKKLRILTTRPSIHNTQS